MTPPKPEPVETAEEFTRRLRRCIEGDGPWFFEEARVIETALSWYKHGTSYVVTAEHSEACGELLAKYTKGGDDGG